MFYVNNYIDWDEFNQLYNLKWMEKGIHNADAIARKLKPALTKATNLRRVEARKKEEVVDRQKAKAIAKKQLRNRGRNSLSIVNDRYYDNDMYGTNPNQEDDFNYLIED